MSSSAFRQRIALVAVVAAGVAGVIVLAVVLAPDSDSGSTTGASSDSEAAQTSSSTGDDGDAPSPTDGANESSPVPPASSAAVSTGDDPEAGDPDGSRDTVLVTNTYSGWDAASSSAVAGAFVSGVIESDGECTLVLTHDGTSLEGTSTALPDATTTSCGELSVSGPELTSGAWEAQVTYRSARSAGESATFTVMVP